MNPLTPTETGILLSLADGLTVGQIADEREVSFHTVSGQVKSLRAKLGARTTAHAVALAYHRGLFVSGRDAA